MIPATIPSTTQLTELTDHRDDASVSIYLPSSPLPTENQAMRLALKNAARQAGTRLESQQVDKVVIDRVLDLVSELDDDPEFWQNQAEGLGILVAPDALHAFRLLYRVPETVVVGDRFRVGPLLRSLGTANAGYVLAVTEGDVCFYGIAAGSRPIKLDLALPSDLHSVLEHADNDGQADRGRAMGSHGQRIEQQRYCRIIQDAVLEQIGDNRLPLILAASNDFGPSYRSVNTYPALLPEGIEVHPDSLSRDELDTKAKAILEQHYRRELVQWKESFGTKRSQGLATSRFDDVARAATSAAIATLHFDVESSIQGTIDDQGQVTKASKQGPDTYPLVDEIASRVLRSGGAVMAVRNKDLTDGSPVAAVLRYPL
ncbi:baeRF11 domain-containing protein [Homoserinimonas sp. A447]